MHAAFIPYGNKPIVDELINQILYTKLPVKCIDKDGKEFHQWVQLGVRMLPLGIYEVIFPKEYKDRVLTALEFHLETPYENIYGWKLKVLLKLIRKWFGYKHWGVIDTKEKMLWLHDWVRIIPIGIKDDEDMTEKIRVEGGQILDLTHEGI